MFEHIQGMLQNYKSLMKMLGFDINKKGLFLFVSLTEEVRDLLKRNQTEQEILGNIHNLILEESHFVLDMNRQKYMDTLNDFLSRRREIPKTISRCFDFNDNDLSLEYSLLYFAKYFNYIEAVDSHTKEMIKKYDLEKK